MTDTYSPRLAQCPDGHVTEDPHGPQPVCPHYTLGRPCELPLTRIKTDGTRHPRQFTLSG